MTKEDLKKLNDNLPKSAKTELAQKFGYTKEYIGQILCGLKPHEEVVLAAVELLADYRKRKDEATKFIQSI